MAEYRAAILFLDEIDGVLAARMRRDVVAATKRLARRPMLGRPSRFPGYRAWSLPKWSKVLIYRAIADGVEIGAMLDARQQPPDQLS